MNKSEKNNKLFYLFLILIFLYFLFAIWLIIASIIRNERTMAISGFLNLLVFFLALIIYKIQEINSKKEIKKLKETIENYKKEINNPQNWKTFQESDINKFKEDAQKEIEKRLNDNILK